MRLTIHSLVIGMLMGCSWLVAQPVEWPVSQGGNGHYYEVVAVPTGIWWTAANQAAQAAGGHLATITSASENTFVFSLVSSTIFWNNGNGWYAGPWLGGYQPPGSPEPSGGWQWVTGEQWSYTNWLAGEPSNNHCGQGGPEDYLQFGLHYPPPSNQWNDYPDSSTCAPSPVAYVVEYSLPTTPGYQSNSVLATLAVNGVWGTAYAPAVVTIPIGTAATLQISSLNIGMVWELGLGLAPLVPANSGGLTTSDGQFLNLDLTDPTFIMMWSFFQSPGFQNVTMPFSVPNAVSLSAQMLVLDPYMASGLSLSQPVRLIVQ